MDLPLTARDAVLVLVLAMAAGASTWFVTRWAAAFLRRRATPIDANERPSDGGTIVPEGGTIVILAVALPMIAAIIWIYEPANPVPWATLFVDRGRLLVAAGRGAPDVVALRALRDEFLAIELRTPVRELDAAIGGN